MFGHSIVFCFFLLFYFIFLFYVVELIMDLLVGVSFCYLIDVEVHCNWCTWAKQNGRFI